MEQGKRASRARRKALLPAWLGARQRPLHVRTIADGLHPGSGPDLGSFAPRRVLEHFHRMHRQPYIQLLSADLAIPDSNPLIAGQLLQTHWPARADFIRADADLRA